MGVISVLMLLVLAPNITFSKSPSNSVNDLYDLLFVGYNSRVRPTKDHNNTTEISVQFSPTLLVSLDTTNQKLTIIKYFTFTWIDELLVWNSSEYNGKNYIQLRVAEIWHPLIKLGIIQDGNSIVGHDHDGVLVNSSGMVQWITEGLFNFVCHIDVTYYPFDTQTCNINVYLPDEYSLDVELSFDRSSFEPQMKSENGEWNVIGVNISLNNVGTTTFIRYSLKLERRAAFILYTSIIPLVSLFFLNAFVLLVPVGSGEKGSIAITFLLSFSVYISSISEHLPTNSLQTPLVLKLMIIMLAESSFILLVAIEQSGLYQYESKSFLPKYLLDIFLCCCRKKPLIKSGTADTNMQNEQCMSSNTTVFECVDRTMFYFAFIVNIIILVSFACGFIFQSA